MGDIFSINLHMRSFKIGDNSFKSKKQAKQYYSNILNSYDFGTSLNDKDYKELIDLLNFYWENKRENEGRSLNPVEETVKQDANSFYIKDIRVVRFRFNKKCFEFVPSVGHSLIISYKHFIDNPKRDDRAIFNRVCRYTIEKDIIELKKEYFYKNAINGKAPCQESKKYLEFAELVVDHRQPNTLSIIIDRFIERNQIDVEKIEYKSSYLQLMQFKDAILAEKFRLYHKEKALLRIVDKKLNASRTGLARIKPLKADIRIEEKQGKLPF